MLQTTAARLYGAVESTRVDDMAAGDPSAAARGRNLIHPNETDAWARGRAAAL